MSARSDVICKLAARIHSLELGHPIRVAIDGIDGAGKTSLADELADLLASLGRPVIRASLDSFHRNRAERYRRGEDSAEGYYRDSFDYAALATALLEPLGPDGNGRYRTEVFDHSDDRPVRQELQTADPTAVLLFDGVFLLRPEIVHSWDFTIFLKTSFAVALERGVSRDATRFGTSGAARDRYRLRYQPGQRLYFAEADPENRADVVVINDELSRPTIASPT